MIRIATILLFILVVFKLDAQLADHVILITLDGVRWQEVFGGADRDLMNNADFTPDKRNVKARFKAENREEARKKLMPWLWSVLAEQGQIYGNRHEGNKMNCVNRYWFSYPGYNEILTGFSDPWINSNSKKYNPNKTILEWFNEQPEFNGQVAAFASWDVFPYIINDIRSEIPINAGFQKADDTFLTSNELFLNDLLDQVSGPWSSVRLDAFTHRYMMEYLKKKHPRLVYISYGETDDYAHEGKYDQYLNSIHQTDTWIQELWQYLQTDPFYAGKTALIITTDHGRGYQKIKDWKNHGILHKGSGEIWLAAIGANIKAKGEIKNPQQLFQNQIAKTLAHLMGYNYHNEEEEVGEIIKSLFTSEDE